MTPLSERMRVWYKEPFSSESHPAFYALVREVAALEARAASPLTSREIEALGVAVEALAYKHEAADVLSALLSRSASSEGAASAMDCSAPVPSGEPHRKRLGEHSPQSAPHAAPEHNQGEAGGGAWGAMKAKER